MDSLLLDSAILIYGIIQVVVASVAVILAIQWEKREFLGGLFFLFLYSVVEIIDVFFFTILNAVSIDVAQYGFILLAIISFIIGMHPSWSSRMAAGMAARKPEHTSPRKESVLSILRRS